MTKFRSIQIQKIHNTLFNAKVDWRALQSVSLRNYVFDHGVKHGFSVDRVNEISNVVLDYEYVLERLLYSTSKRLLSVIRDLNAIQLTSNVESNVVDIRLLEQFLRTNTHLLNFETTKWGVDKIFHQLAMEHAEDSPLTKKGTEWLRASPTDWYWFMRKRRPTNVPINPCIQTLLTDEEEWSCMEEWNGFFVASDCCSNLWVWDREHNDVKLQIEITGYETGPLEHIALWDATTVYLWHIEDDDVPEPFYDLENQYILSISWLTPSELLIITEQGDVFLLDIQTKQSSVVVSFGDNRHICLKVVSRNAVVVYQEGWIECDESEEDYEDSGDEWDDTEDTSSEQSEEPVSDHDEDSFEDGDDDWSEEVEEVPSDPTLYLCTISDDRSMQIQVTAIYKIDEGISECIVHGLNGILVDKNHGIHLVDVLSGTLLKKWSILEGSGVDIYVLSEQKIAVVQWDDEEKFVVNVLSTNAPYNSMELHGHTDLLTSMKGLSHNRAISTSFDNTAIVWDLTTGKQVFSFSNIVPHDLSGAVVLDDNVVAVWSVSGHILLWDVEQQKHIGTLLGHTSSVSDVIVLSNGQLASIAMFEPSLRIWEPSIAPLKPPLDNHDDVVISHVPICNTMVVTGSHDKTFRVWDVESAKTRLMFSEHTEPVECVDWVNDTELLSGAWDGVLLHWNISGQVIQRFVGHTDWVRGFKVLPHGKLLSWSDDCTLRLWEMSSGHCIHTFEGHDGPVRDGLTMNDGRWLSWSEDGTLRIWDLESMTCDCILEGHANHVDTALIQENGAIVSYNHEDWEVPCEIRIWDPSSASCTHVFSGLDAEVIELVVLNEHMYARTYANVFSWKFASPDQPTEHLLIDFSLEYPNIWERLHAAEKRSLHHAVQTDCKSGRILITVHGVQTQWTNDGDWRVHQITDSGIMVVTCWNDVAFLQLYQGSSPIGLV